MMLCATASCHNHQPLFLALKKMKGKETTPALELIKSDLRTKVYILLEPENILFEASDHIDVRRESGVRLKTSQIL